MASKCGRFWKVAGPSRAQAQWAGAALLVRPATVAIGNLRTALCLAGRPVLDRHLRLRHQNRAFPIHHGYAMSSWVAKSLPVWLLTLLSAVAGVAVPVAVGMTISKQASRQAPTVGQKQRSRGGVGVVGRVTKRLLQGRRRRQVACLLIVLVLALVLSNVMVVAQSYAQRDYMSALAQRDTALFFRGLGLAFFLLSLSIPSRCMVDLVTGAMAITFREAITQSLISQYFQPRAVFWLRREGAVPDPDMRMSTEAGHFAESAVLMIRDILENGLKLLGFMGVVYAISPRLCGAMLLYAGLGALATVFIFGRPLVRLDRSIRAREASFRASLSRCYGQGESLCFARGESAEAEASSERYSLLQQQQWSRVWWRTGLVTFRECFDWLARLVPLALAAPLWLRGDIAFGVIVQLLMAFQVSLNALSIVIRKFRSVSSLVAEGTRLDGLAEALGRITDTSMALPVREEGAGVELGSLTLFLPSGGALCRDVSLSLQPGERLLIVGESGSGKTTLLRALAGLWTDGTGKLRRPASSVFLSQDPYIPEGSLRRVLTFPASAEVLPEDSKIISSARAARIEDLLGRYSLDSVADWEAVLSRGEKQRCTFCRLLLAQPELVVLDEATSALDEENEATLYAALEAACVISVSHRPALMAYHTHVLRRDGEDSWRVERIQ